jgi:hypothetical protein
MRRGHSVASACLEFGKTLLDKTTLLKQGCDEFLN